MESDNFTLERFSTDLITECFLQQLETSVPARHYPGSLSYTEGLKKWIKLTDTLIHCLKNDLRGCKGSSKTDANNADHPLANSCRIFVADVICNWAKDMNSLKGLYEERYLHKIKEERVQKEIDAMYLYLGNLCDLSLYISQRRKEKEDEICSKERYKEEESCGKSEMVFIFDDHENSLNG